MRGLHWAVGRGQVEATRGILLRGCGLDPCPEGGIPAQPAKRQAEDVALHGPECSWVPVSQSLDCTDNS